MFAIDKCRERDLNDPTYHALVMCLRQTIVELQLSPSEIREAAMFACYCEETARPSREIPIPDGHRPI
jgi:hypothetical protein